MAKLPPAILFDLDDTILRSYGQTDAWARVLARYAPDLERHIGPAAHDRLHEVVLAVGRDYWAVERETHRARRLDMLGSRRAIVRDAFSRFGIGDDALVEAVADHFTALREAEVQPFEGALAALLEIRRRGTRMALVTNGAAQMQRDKIDRFGLAPLFDLVLIEGEFGRGKPEPEVYLHALAALDSRPEGTWMVGDNLEWEVAAPQELGIYAVWHDAYDTGLPPDPPATPDRVIRRIAELVEDDA